MNIKLRLFATLREGRGKEIVFEVPDNTKVIEVMDRYNIPREEVAILLVNGRDAAFEQMLKDWDTISVFPPVGGG